MAAVEFKDNSAKLLKEFKTWQGVALNLIGARGTEHVQDNTPIRTGNLVNHADWEVDEDEASVSIGFKHDDDPERNPYYAIFVEEGSVHNVAHHMVKRAVTEHNDEYKGIAEKAAKNA